MGDRVRILRNKGQTSDNGRDHKPFGHLASKRMDEVSQIDVIRENYISIMPAGWDLRQELSVDLAWFLLNPPLEGIKSVSYSTLSPKSYAQLVTK
jgi:hypothetical protein